jgi:hypothetical protein
MGLTPRSNSQNGIRVIPGSRSLNWIRDNNVKTAGLADRIMLRRFGLTFGALFVVFFDLIIPWIGGGAFPLSPWYVGALVWLWAAAHPQNLASLFHGWLRIGAVVGWLSTRIILLIVFYLVIVQIALMNFSTETPWAGS